MRAGAVRTRPILLTAGAAMLAAVPITLDPIFSGLAWALIFGLFVSTAFTLLVVPVVYELVYRNRPGHGLPAGGAGEHDGFEMRLFWRSCPRADRAWRAGRGGSTPPLRFDHHRRPARASSRIEERGRVLESASGAVASARHPLWRRGCSRRSSSFPCVRRRGQGGRRRGRARRARFAAREGEAQQALTSARAQLGLADREAARIGHLVDEGVATVQERDHRTAAALRVARAEAKRAQESLAAARVAKSYAELRAPVSGARSP